jgi:hypothetical protein
MKNSLILLVAFLCFQCKPDKGKDLEFKPFIMESSIQQSVDSLVTMYGESNRDRIEKGVRLTASFWMADDGSSDDFRAFCRDNFISDTVKLHEIFQRISTNLEVIMGYFTKISVDLQRPLQLDMGEILPVDERFGAYNPATHFVDDFFSNKIAFIITLNFPHYTLEEKTRLGSGWSRQEWAYARLGDVFDSRVPAAVSQLVVDASTRSDMYIADYNIFAGKLVDSAGHTYFPADMKLLSHWNLRDEIKSNYGKEGGLEKQRMLYAAMKRIISQEIPREVINSDRYNWNPYTNKLFDGEKEVNATPESEMRYSVLLDFFHAQQKVDPYYPDLNTYIRRTFESDMEIPLADVEELFKTVLSSPQAKKVGQLIAKRLGRNLEPFDIWYDGFKTRTSIPSELLDQATRNRYPDREAVQADLPVILMKLGFRKDKAYEITSHIQVDPARGSGHATGAEIRNEKSLLRTRIFSNGMDYKGYNIAIHEFGHNVEQTISLHDVDYYLLHGVPNTAFTEALAFIFQQRDLELLGFHAESQQREYLDHLDAFWSIFEIMGVSLVDIETWKWLYDNPKATPAELRDAVNQIALETWNQYYAPVIGVSDQIILGIYSHMINAPLYLPNYAYGDIIKFQLEEFLKGRDFAGEIERIFSLGRLTPQQWMQEATGGKLSVQPLLDAADEALDKIK